MSEETIEEEVGDTQQASKEKLWITYVIRNPKNGEYTTISEPFNEEAPEHDTIPNQKSFFALYKGKDVKDNIRKANIFIRKQQQLDIDNVSFEKIRQINKLKPQESYVELPNGQGYRIKTMDELKKEGKA